MSKSMYVRSGSRYRVAKGVEILEAAAFVEALKIEGSRERIPAPAAAMSFLAGQLRHCLEEFFCILYLDATSRVIAFEKAFRGTIDASVVHTREIVREVLDRNAHSVVLAHNHPSGIARPSDADRRVTQKMKAALQLIDVQVLDHIIVGETECFSFAEHGLL